MNYYNEFDPFAAAWLRELIADKLIPEGEVDERSIADVSARDLDGFAQCHFFAGIAGWSYALELAGWPADRPVWTGSPPCQPFSSAGKRKGKDDERHLWPVFFNLIRECKPPAIFGEQVASAIRSGWFDDLQADLEAEDYASGMVVLPACSVGAPHKRERLFYFAKSLADTSLYGHEQRELGNEAEAQCSTFSGGKEEGCRGYDTTNGGETAKRVDNSECAGLEGRTGARHAEGGRAHSPGSCTPSGVWDDPQFAYCRDGKCRPIPVEPALFPLADGIPNRVGILRGAGNAIVPQVAAEVVAAFMGGQSS